MCQGLPQSCCNSCSDCLSACSYDGEAVEKNGGDIKKENLTAKSLNMKIYNMDLPQRTFHTIYVQ